MSGSGIARARPPLLVYLLLATICVSLLLRASFAAPRGTAFVGTFAYPDDFFNYLSMVEQAQRGELVFKSKLASPTLPPALVNLEWLVVGWLAALMGGRTVLAYRVFGMLALGAWVFATDRFLVRSGLPEGRRVAGLLLVFTGGGVGGLLWGIGWVRGERAFDLRTGAFPFVEALANPHFIAGSALLLGALAAFAAGRIWCGAALGFVLAFVRPYDATLLVAIEGASVLLLASGGSKLRRLLPLAVVLPGLAYTWWVFAASPGFRVWVSPRYSELVPTALELAIALGPAALLALSSTSGWTRGAGERAHLTRLALWVAIALLVVTMRPVSYSLQFVVGVGLPLLALAAVGLARLDRHILETSTALMCSTAVAVTWLFATPNSDTHVVVERWRLVVAARALCQPGDLVLAPEDIGLYFGGLTPCWPFVSHAAAPDYDARVRAVRRFQGAGTPPHERAGLLQSLCPKYVVLPPVLPEGWLGAKPAYRPHVVVSGPNGALALWSRDPSVPCSQAKSP